MGMLLGSPGLGLDMANLPSPIGPAHDVEAQMRRTRGIGLVSSPSALSR